mgnify:CR=1 FL=1
MLIPPSTTQVVDEAGLELLELFKGSWFVREEIEAGFGVSCDIDNSFMNAIINPVPGNIKYFCNLGYREIAVNSAWMGLMTLLHDTVFQTDSFNRAGQQKVFHWRSKVII